MKQNREVWYNNMKSALAKGGGTMEYTLMHKNIPVLDFDLDELTSSVHKIGAVYHLEIFPLERHPCAERSTVPP